MKKALVLLLLMFACCTMYSQEYVLLEINSEWNWSNKAKIDKIEGVTYKAAYLEPLVILYKDGKPIKRWQADLSFKLIITKEQVLKAIENKN